jgi:hypothetical protein
VRHPCPTCEACRTIDARHECKCRCVVDYRAHIDKTYLGQWDLAKADGTGFNRAVVQIEWVQWYRPAIARKKKDPEGRKDPKTGKVLMIPERLKNLEISFVGKRKHWLAGPVSQATIHDMYGKNVREWIGQRLTLYVDPTVKNLTGRVTGGIRCEPIAPKGHIALTPDPLDNEPDPETQDILREAWGEGDDAAPPADTSL